MEEFKKTLVLDLESALKPDVEQFATYDAIFLPREFKTNAPLSIWLLYKPFKHVYYYGKFE